MSKIEANMTRPRRDCLKIFIKVKTEKRQLPNFVRDWDKTENLGTFSYETETRLRLSSFTGNLVIIHCLFPVTCCWIFWWQKNIFFCGSLNSSVNDLPKMYVYFLSKEITFSKKRIISCHIKSNYLQKTLFLFVRNNFFYMNSYIHRV